MIDGAKIGSITGNLGDARTTIAHPATTTHGRITPDARAAGGIAEGLISLAIGLENAQDVRNDRARGLVASAVVVSNGCIIVGRAPPGPFPFHFP